MSFIDHNIIIVNIGLMFIAMYNIEIELEQIQDTDHLKTWYYIKKM